VAGSVNPYQSPTIDCSARGDVVVFKARYLPRDWADWAIGLPLLAVGLLLGGGIIFACYALTRSPLLSIVSPLGVMLPLLWITGRGVKDVTVDSDALIFRRVAAESVVVPWENVTSVRLATRWETFVAGLVRPRSVCSYSLTLRDNCRVDWSGDYAYFPPRDPVIFLDTIRSHITPSAAPTAHETDHPP